MSSSFDEWIARIWYPHIYWLSIRPSRLDLGVISLVQRLRLFLRIYPIYAIELPMLSNAIFQSFQLSFKRRWWKMSPGLDRVYVNEKV